MINKPDNVDKSFTDFFASEPGEFAYLWWDEFSKANGGA